LRFKAGPLQKNSTDSTDFTDFIKNPKCGTIGGCLRGGAEGVEVFVLCVDMEAEVLSQG
jgi:hypothetical protein